MPRMDTASGWRRRALRLVELCQKLDAEHVLCKAMRRWPVAALLEATEGWGANLFAMVARDWRLRKVARLLEAKGRSFTLECCLEWEPEFLQVLLPSLDLATARHVLAQLYFKTEDKFLSPWECRCILEQFTSKAQRKLLRKFSDKDVARVLHAAESDDGSEGEEDEEEEDGDSMDGFIVCDGEVEDEDAEEADEEGDFKMKAKKIKISKGADSDEEEDEDHDDEADGDEDGDVAVDAEDGDNDESADDDDDDGDVDSDDEMEDGDEEDDSDEDE